jgi:hypothetical protein
VLLHHVQQGVHARHALLSAVQLHCVRELGVVVEEGGNDGELDLGGHAGAQPVVVADGQQLTEQLDLLIAVVFFLLPRAATISINFFSTSSCVISASCASKKCIYDRKTLEIGSVADPRHFGTDPGANPDPWIRTSV